MNKLVWKVVSSGVKKAALYQEAGLSYLVWADERPETLIRSSAERKQLFYM